MEDARLYLDSTRLPWPSLPSEALQADGSCVPLRSNDLYRLPAVGPHQDLLEQGTQGGKHVLRVQCTEDPCDCSH